MRAVALLLAAVAQAGAPGALFTDVTVEAGIGWTHFNGESPARYLVESTTGGIGFLDFDGDGRLDLYLVNGGDTPGRKSPSPVLNALYRNLGNGRFRNVAATARVDRFRSYGMGIAAADYDNDGRTDLYVTGYPSSTLFHNAGDGTFEDVSKAAGLENAGEWATSAAWFDYDRDGLLDLFVANYAEFSFDDKRRCDFAGRPVYCSQTDYKGRPPKLYRNEGNGKFRDATRDAQLTDQVGRALGVVAIDVNSDGWIDLFVARDASPNLLLLNQKNGTFRDAAFEAEVAFNEDGVARAGMGVDAGDVDGNGTPDFIVTNFDSEYHALYLNPGKMPLREVTAASRLAAFTKPFVGWGVRFLDYDNDGDLDLLIANGHLQETISESNRSVQYREPPLLLANDGKGAFTNIAKAAGPAFAAGYLGRGLATADFDNDGGIDAAFINLNGKPVVLRNTSAARGHWVGLHLEGRRSNRDAIGARIVLTQGDRRLTRWVTGGGSFLATHDRRVSFGLGQDTTPVEFEITWPNGSVQRVAGLSLGRYHRIVEAAESAAGSEPQRSPPASS
jgi:hypothetical protein